jgi:HNH endonuclease
LPAAPATQGSCYYCERGLGLVNKRFLLKTRDHIIPVSLGGINNKRNYVDACERCNTLKTNMTPEEFANFIGLLLEGKSKTGAGREIAKNTLVTILYNCRKLILKIAPYRDELIKKQPVLIIEDTEWPDPEKEDKLDWSLSYEDMARKYNPSCDLPKKSRKRKSRLVGRHREPFVETRNISPIVQEIADKVKKEGEPSFEKFSAKFKNKFPHAYEIIESANPDILRWLYDNIMPKKEWVNMAYSS